MKSLIHKYGLYEINEDDMQEGMLKGAIEGYTSTDPYAVYYPAKHNASIDDNADIHAESYKGIGAMVNVNDEGSLTVQQVFKDSGASDAGLKEGDKITSINGTTVTEDNADELLQNVKSDENETVTAEVQDGEQQKEVLITKKEVTSPKVTYQITETEDDLDIRNGIGYISISDFAGNAATQFKDTIDRMTTNHELKGIILDLRNNGGGEIDNACEILDYILKDDITTYSKNIKKKENEGHTFLTRVESNNLYLRFRMVHQYSLHLANGFYRICQISKKKASCQILYPKTMRRTCGTSWKMHTIHFNLRSYLYNFADPLHRRVCIETFVNPVQQQKIPLRFDHLKYSLKGIPDNVAIYQ